MQRALPLVLLLSLGCFRTHGDDADPDGGVLFDGGAPDAFFHDAGPRDGGSDAPLFLDAGGPSCPAVRADYTCLESFVAPADRPFELPLTFDACACCAPTSCAVSVDHGTKTLELGSGLCLADDICDCIACNHPVARCEVPALERGEWTVRVDGDDAFVLPVEHDDAFVAPPPACVRYAEPDPCGDISNPLEGVRDPVTTLCVRRTPFPGEAVLELTNDCGTCSHEGTCDVELRERLTDDLPPGGDLYVSAERFFGACEGACPAVCVETTRACPTPRLELGDTYRIFVDGELLGVFEHDEDDEDFCISRAIPLDVDDD